MIEVTGESWPTAEADLAALQLCERCLSFGGSKIGPEIPPDALRAAFSSYLDLRGDEILLAIVRASKDDPADSGCALTTRRIHWPGHRDEGEGDEIRLVDPGRRPSARPRGPTRRCLAFDELPREIGRVDGPPSSIDLGSGRRVTLGGHPALQAAMIDFLGRARVLPIGAGLLAEAPPGTRERLERAWPGVREADERAKGLQVVQVALRRRFQRTSRAVVTPMIAAACVAVYAAMLVVGRAQALNPTAAWMVPWGAVFGPSIAIDHEYWRLVTAMFLHFGAMHLVLNMWCLIGNGPMIERFFGHRTFAAIYLLSGLGGSIASLWAHPLAICAGASGAIFGILGALLGFALARRGDIPAESLGPLHSGAGAFVLYNLLFGMLDPRIDTAAHLGGLATGFVAGLLLAPPTVPGRSLRRPILGVALATGLILLAWTQVGPVRARVLADPGIVREQRANDALAAWNEFHLAFGPASRRFDELRAGYDRIAASGNRGDIPAEDLLDLLDGLIPKGRTLLNEVKSLPARDGEIRAMRDSLQAAARSLGAATEALKPILKGDNAADSDALKGHLASYEARMAEFATLRTAYFRAHDLVETSD